MKAARSTEQDTSVAQDGLTFLKTGSWAWRMESRFAVAVVRRVRRSNELWESKIVTYFRRGDASVRIYSYGKDEAFGVAAKITHDLLNDRPISRLLGQQTYGSAIQRRSQP